MSALKQVKRFVDDGTPVTIGAVDMFHLPYFRHFYRHTHIPIHYLLMVGYDDAKQRITVYDCDRDEPQHVSYDDLEKAWGVRTEGFSKPFTYFVHHFDAVKSPEEIINKGLRKKSRYNLNPPVSFMGIKGIRKLSSEIISWKSTMDEEEYRRCLLHFTEYTGFPPSLPNRLLEEANAKEYRHMAGREIMCGVLRNLSSAYGNKSWDESAQWFARSGAEIEALTETITDCLVSQNELPLTVSASLHQIADLEEKAYLCLGN